MMVFGTTTMALKKSKNQFPIYNHSSKQNFKIQRTAIITSNSLLALSKE
jgi:hypothetical protein